MNYKILASCAAEFNQVKSLYDRFTDTFRVDSSGEGDLEIKMRQDQVIELHPQRDLKVERLWLSDTKQSGGKFSANELPYVINADRGFVSFWIGHSEYYLLYGHSSPDIDGRVRFILTSESKVIANNTKKISTSNFLVLAFASPRQITFKVGNLSYDVNM